MLLGVVTSAPSTAGVRIRGLRKVLRSFRAAGYVGSEVWVALFVVRSREFITGASKRKEQRRKEAHERALQKQKEEKRLLRAQVRHFVAAEHIAFMGYKPVYSLATPHKQDALCLQGCAPKSIYLVYIRSCFPAAPRGDQRAHQLREAQPRASRGGSGSCYFSPGQTPKEVCWH